MTEPPRRMERLLRLLLPPDAHGEAVLGDLREEYARRAASRASGASAVARSWYRREAVALGARYAAVRFARWLRRLFPPAWLQRASRDLATAGRSLSRDPAFVIATAGVLAIGIGAVTAVFTLVDRVLFQPLPYADEERVVSVYEANASGSIRQLSYPTFRDWRPEASAFEGLAFVRGEPLGVRGPQGRWLLLASYGTPELFRVMDARPVLGRVIEPGDARAPVAVLAWHTWREQFGGDPDVIGRGLSTDNGPVTIVGVMPEDVRYPAWSDLWLPLGALPPQSLQALERRDLRADSGVVGRIRDDVTLDRASVELSALAHRAAEVEPDSRGWTRVVLRTLREELVGAEPARLLVVAIAAGVLLLIAAANVAGLLVARTAARRRELAVRVALGATGGRLTGPLAAESSIIALIGGAAGVLLATATVRVLAVAAPDALPRLEGAAVDVRALAVTMIASFLVAIAFALLTARRATRVPPMDALRSARGAAAGRGVDRLRSALVVAEVALATLLVLGATSTVQALLRLNAVELGIETDGVVAAQIMPPSPRYDSPEAAVALYRRLEAAAQAVPGVRSAALVNLLPLTRGFMPTRIRTARVPGPDEQPAALYRSVSADYFDTLGIKLLRGGAPTRAEIDARAPVVVVNEALAAREWPDRDPVGKSITVHKVAQNRPDFGDEMTLTVIGVAANTRARGPANDPPPTIYVPYTVSVWGHTYVVARGDGNVHSLGDELRRALLDVDPTLPLAGPHPMNRVRPLTDSAASWLRAERIGAGVVSGFALAALVLAATGLFGVVAYLVLQRSRELGVRLALGATPRALIGLVVGYGARLTAIGWVIGFGLTLAAGRVLGATTLPLPAARPGAFVLTAAVFAIAVLSACIAPARRAARVPPVSVLRDDG